MTLFGLFSLPERGPEAIAAVPDRFRWSAFVFAPLWALANRLWLYFAFCVAIIVVLYPIHLVIGRDAALALYGIFALWSGFAAGSIQSAALKNRGWIDHGDCTAPTREMAEAVWLNHFYGAKR